MRPRRRPEGSRALAPRPADVRDVRLEVGLRGKEILGRRSRIPYEFVTIPLNEPIP